MPVIKDVARLAGVSVGSVSKYLNGCQTLKPETARRIASAVSQLHYQPNLLARSMRTGKTNMIAVIVPNISNPFFTEVFNSVRIHAVQRGYTPILFTVEDDMNMTEQFIDNLSRHQVDGLILCFVDEESMIENYLEEIGSQMPSVVLSWNMRLEHFHSVSIDVCDGLYKATSHLIGLGRRTIAYIGGHRKIEISAQKFLGYKKAMDEAGLTVDSRLVFAGDLSLKGGYQAAGCMGQEGPMPDAVVTENDITAIGCLKYFSRMHIKVPGQIAIIGFDNIMLSGLSEPPLSTIAMPIRLLGSESTRMLLSAIDQPDLEHQHVILNNELVVRRSTDPDAPIDFAL